MARIRGTNRNDFLFGTRGRDRIDGRDGDDLIISGGGDDRVRGGSGDDIILSGSGNDRVRGDSGDDIIIAGSGDDRVRGGSGSDIILGGSGDDRIDGGRDDDIILGGDGDDRIDGGSGDDLISGGDGDDRINGGSGNDTISGDDGNDRINGGSGDDTIAGGAGDDRIRGDGGNDTIDGGTGDDNIRGGSGDDIIDGGDGDDRIRGDSGDDTIDGGAGDDNIRGGSGNDTIDGGAGNDSIRGGRGDDSIYASDGSDFIDGGRGSDTVFYSGSRDDYTITRSGRTTTVEYRDDAGNLVTDTLRNVENIEFAEEPNSNPVAVDDTLTVDEGVMVMVNGVLDNDVDPDPGDTLTVTHVNGATGNVGSQITLPSGALLTMNADGTYMYDPNGAFNSLALGETTTDSFTYTATDSSGATDTATLTITINGANDAPVAADDAGTVGEDGVYVVAADGVLANDVDPDASDVLTVTEVAGSAANVGTQFTLPSGALLQMNADGSCRYDPNGVFNSLAVGETATETFTYTVSDGNGGTDTATATITITGANDAPTANDDAVTVGEDQVFVDSDGVLTNDIDPDTSDVLSVTEVEGSAVDGVTGLVQVTLGSGAIVTMNADGTYNYNTNGAFETLAVGDTATDSFSYTMSDGNGGFDTATVTLTIQGANDAPDAVDDTATVAEDGALIVPAAGGVLANDLDVDAGSSFSVTEVSGLTTVAIPATGAVPVPLASGAILAIGADGSYTYIPFGAFDDLIAGETATDTFTYTITDEHGATDTATVTITITGVGAPPNQAPTANNDTGSVGEDGSLSVAANGVLSNDSDPDGDMLTVTEVEGLSGNVGTQITLGSGALLTLNADGSYDYNPNGVFDGLNDGETATDSFTYTVDDGNGGTDTATVTVTINGATDNSAPIAVNDTLTVDEGVMVSVNGVLDNDVDPDPGDTLTVTHVNGDSGNVGGQITLPSGALLTMNSDGTYSYDPNGAFNSLAVGETTTDSFTYTATDSFGATDTATLTITINGANDAPTATADAVGVGEGDVAAATGNLLGNDSDPDTSDVLSVTSVQTEAGAVTAIDPAAGAVTITLAMGGVLTIAADGSYSFDPNGEFESLAAGQTATETVTYTVSDGNGGTDSAVVTFTVTGANDGPVATADVVGVGEDDIAATTGNLLGNDSDVDAGDVLSVSSVQTEAGAVTAIDPAAGAVNITLAMGGVLTIAADGSYSFDPNGEFESLAEGQTATETVTYTVSDGNGGTDTAVVTFTVTGTNDGPVASADAVGVGEDDAAATTGNLLGNDSDVDAGDVLSVSSVQTEAGAVTAIDPAAGAVNITLAMGGVLTIASDGSYSYDPNGEFGFLSAGQSVTETVTYTLDDGNGGTDTAVVTFTVTGTNNAPVADADTLSATEDVGLVFNASDLLTGDSDVDGGTLSIAAIEGQTPVVGTAIPVAGSAATVTLNADGTYTYDQNGAFNSLAVGAIATDTFMYTVSDGQGGTDTATVTVTITGTNDGPVASADFVGVGEDDVAATTGNLLGNDSDVDVGDVLSVTSVQTEAGAVTAIDPAAGAVNITLAMGGVLTIAADGSYSYDPNGEFDGLAAGQTATETVTYTVDDGNGGTDTAVVTFTVTGTNDGPVAGADAGATDENTVLSVPANGVLSNDSDPDAGDSISITAVQGSTAAVGTQITLASGALLTMNADGSYDYDPNGQFQSLLTGETAIDSFTYTITDGQGATDTATVTVTIDGISNSSPIASNDTVTTTEDDALIVNPDGVLANDIDPDGDTLTITAVEGSAGNVGTQITLASGALLTLNADGSYDYDPNGAFDSLAVGQTGIDTFTYTVDDGNGATDTASVTVTLTGVNDAPVAVADRFVVAHDDNTEIESPTFLDNDFDPEDGASVTLVSIDGTPVDFSAGYMDVFLANGDIVSFNPDYSFFYVLNDPAAGDLLFGESITTGPVEYVIEDSTGAQTTGSITFVVANATFNVQDLDGTNGFVVNGVGSMDLAGHSVSSAGDVNGDGYDDFIVGAFQANPTTGVDAGASYVVFGSASGVPGGSLNLSSLDGSNGFAINGAVAGQFSGRSVSSAGDINGDGIDDILVGIRDESNGGVAGSESAYVIYGTDTGFAANVNLGSLATSDGFAITGIDANFSDIVVGSAGDVNGDGIDDIVIGSQGAGTSNVGASYVVFGQSGGFGSGIDVSTLNGANGFSITGADAADNFGFAVTAGDLNNDGYDDVIVGAVGSDPSGTNNAGEVYVVYGAGTGLPSNIDVSTLNGTNGFAITGANIDGEAGNSISSAGDINGDGIDDLVIGERGYYYGTGGAYVVFGQDGGLGTGVDLASLDGTNGFRITGNQQGDEAGYSVAMAGDINGDGFDDIIVGARGVYGYDYYGYSYANFGESYVVFGSAGGFGANVDLSQLDGSNGFIIGGANGEDTLGTSVSSAGDVNGDGYDDLIVGAPKTDATGNDSGASYIVYGQDFGGSVTHQGTSAADTLTGDATANRMIGGQGDDFLTGAGGMDVLYGGEGNDTLAIADLAPQRIDGGSGEDTLLIEGASLNIDLGSLPISGIEAVDITGTGDNVLTLNVLDVLEASDTSNTLKVLGDLGDQVVAQGGWASAGQQLDGGVLFDVYTAGEATLMVDSDINNVVIV